MNLKKLLLFIILIFALSYTNAQDKITIVTKKTQFVAGNSIELAFKTTSKKEYKLYCTNSYGTTLLSSKNKNNRLLFKIPSAITNKIGVVNWQIIGTSISGKFTITSKEKLTSLETYLGPPSIEAGGKDFTMLVVIPTDSLDNPIKENTHVTLKEQFLSSEKTSPFFTKNLIAYQRIFSPKKSGRMLLSTSSLNFNSKEYDVNVMPAIGTNFQLFAKRNHEYADGNQITTFYTSIIKDKNNNVVSDGTLITLFITNKKNNILKTSGTTINGVAFAKIIHPEWEENWQVKAYINGIAESNILKINYKKVFDNFKVAFSKKNRNIIVGPLKSFMNQMIPDGFKVKLTISKNGKLVDEIIKKSKDGAVSFYLDANIYKDDIYKLTVTSGGISKTFKTKKLW